MFESDGIFFHKNAPVRRSFDYRYLERFALRIFSECPKFITLVRHTNLADTTPLHCVCAGTKEQVHLRVPKQDFLFKMNHNGVRFSVVEVIEENHFEKRWLVVCEWNRQGFLLPHHVLTKHGDVVPMKRYSARQPIPWQRFKTSLYSLQ